MANRVEELSNFQHGNVIGCHLSNKSVRQISALLELLQSTVSAVIVTWKHLGATTAQPRSGRPHKLTERNRRVSGKIVCRRLQYSLPSSKLTMEATSAEALFRKTFRKWVSMAEQPHTSLRSRFAMPSISWSGVKLTTIGLWSDESCTTIWMDEQMNH